MTDKIELRPLSEEDLAFFFTHWLKSYKQGSSFARRIKWVVFKFWHSRIINAILEKPATRTVIAHLKDEPEVILGFLCYELINGDPGVVHYVFVKEAFRRIGIARFLFESQNIPEKFYFTHMTYEIEPYINQRESLIYDPYRI